MSSKSNDVADLVRLTGTPYDCTEEALSTYYNDKRTALAAIVQCNLSIDQRDNATRNEVNELLTDTYDKVKEVLHPDFGHSEEAVWQSLAKNNWEVDRTKSDFRSPSLALGEIITSDSDEEATPRAPHMKQLNAPSHFTGPLIEMDHFWETEVEARCTLMNKSYGFMERNRAQLSDALRPRMLKWVENATTEQRSMPIQYYEILNRDEHNTRVIIKDVVRAFFDPRTRSRFENFIFAMFHEVSGGSYGQELSFVAAICLLTLNEQETAAIIRYTAREMEWSVPRSFNTNAWLIESIFEKRFPEVAKHFLRMNFWPDTYMQKVLNSLCIHVLPFELMFNFLDAFFSEGFIWLVKFELAIVDYFQKKLLSITNPNDISLLFDIMRLDLSAVTPEDQRNILNLARNISSAHEDLQGLTQKKNIVYREKVLPRVEKLPSTSDFEPCEICQNRKPVLLCDNCGAICRRCHRRELGEHSQTHQVSDW